MYNSLKCWFKHPLPLSTQTDINPTRITRFAIRWMMLNPSFKGRAWILLLGRFKVLFQLLTRIPTHQCMCSLNSICKDVIEFESCIGRWLKTNMRTCCSGRGHSQIKHILIVQDLWVDLGGGGREQCWFCILYLSYPYTPSMKEMFKTN